MSAWRSALTAAAVVCGLSCPAQAQQTVADFYKGRSLDLLIPFTTGGGYDAYARLVARYIGKHIPGSPQVVPKQMLGAGGRTATMHVYKIAPRDGTVLATTEQSLPLAQATGDPSIQWDSKELIWIGNPINENNTVASWTASGVTTIEDARKREVVIAGAGINTAAQFAMALNRIAGTKFKFISGYPGANEMHIAMERGEVDARTNSWASWKAMKPDWVRDHKISVLVQIGLRRSKDLPDVPLLTDLAGNDEDRAALRILSASSAIGRPLFTTPGTPPDRVKALRDAFDATMKDPEFLETAKREGLDIDSVGGEDLQRIVTEIVAAPKQTIERLSAIISTAELENRK